MSDLNPDVAAKLNSIHPMLGYAASVIFLLGILVNAWNTYRTKKNTAANESTLAMLAAEESRRRAHEEKLIALKNEAVKEFEGTINFAKNQLMAEIDKFKIVMVKVNRDADQKLSMIPKIQDAVAQIEKRSLETEFKAAQQDEKLERFIAGLERLRRNKG